jgi:2-oxoglutarate dehydrogenase E2 component (dihydrolipoamide succinyltransferase)
VEVASPGSGTLREIIKQEQEEIAPGELLGRIEVAGAAAGLGGAGANERIVAGEDGAIGAATHGGATGAKSAADANDAERAHGPVGVHGSAGANGAASAAKYANAAKHAGSNEAPLAGTAVPGPAALNLSPAVRRLLAERGLDASLVRGTGIGGRVTVEDVLAHGRNNAATGAAPSPAAPAGAAPAPAGAAPTAAGGAPATAVGAPARTAAAASSVAALPTDPVTGPSHRVPHTATRKRIAEHMVQSLLHTAPHVTTVFEADLTAVLEDRQRRKDDFARRGAPLTLTAYFLQATVAALRAVPEANSRWTDSALEIYDSIHIGVGTALDTGLVVPVLHNVQTLDLFATAKGLNDLVSRARDGGLTPADMRGGTFTISNHGVSGSLVATPIIINQPQSAILGIGKLEKRPVVLTDEQGQDRIAIRPQCYVTLTIDHRVMDGHRANRFLQTFVAWLTQPPLD